MRILQTEVMLSLSRCSDETSLLSQFRATNVNSKINFTVKILNEHKEGARFQILIFTNKIQVRGHEEITVSSI